MPGAARLCRWLDKKHGLMVELPALDCLPQAGDNLLQMTLRIVTSSMKGAGTDANVVRPGLDCISMAALVIVVGHGLAVEKSASRFMHEASFPSTEWHPVPRCRIYACSGSLASPSGHACPLSLTVSSEAG